LAIIIRIWCTCCFPLSPSINREIYPQEPRHQETLGMARRFAQAWRIGVGTRRSASSILRCLVLLLFGKPVPQRYSCKVGKIG
jgi:hypothetical protein